VDQSLTDIYGQISHISSNGLIKSADGVISIGGRSDGKKVSIANKDGKPRIFTGVANGEVSESSTEAVSGSQLYFMSKQLASYLGGGAKYENGEWIAPSFNISQFIGSRAEKMNYNSVSGAFAAVDQGLLDLNKRLNDLQNYVPSSSGGLSWNKDKEAYHASYNDQAANIMNVVDGEVERGSTDTVNGGQLWNMSNQLDNLGNKVDSLEEKLNNAAGMNIDGVVSYDTGDDGNKSNQITLTGGNGSEPVVIDNLANGYVEAGSKEAVNGGQLHDKMKTVLGNAEKYTDEKIGDAINQVNSHTDMKFAALSYEIEHVRQEARQAAAIGLAVSNLRYDDTPGTLSFGIAGGIWRSQSALAFGAGYTSENGNTRSNLSVINSGRHWGLGAGFTMSFN
ncbi:YadA-like family protein, partial [Bartonella sp. cb54]|uniref:YadA-like family protein n=1 Tax=Bartonella sp. cb54 TaxID=3385560 RepID=UPI0039A6D743